MSNIAISYDSKDGQTKRIAERMAAVMQADEQGCLAEVHHLRQLPDGFDLALFDGFVLGAPLYAGRHSRQVTAFVKRHKETLSRKPSFFFSVSLSAAGKTERQQQNAQRCLDDFLKATGWTPRHSAMIAGALLYQKYNWFIRWIMKRIARKEGGDTDTSRNYEYTDWDQVEAFARKCADILHEEMAA